MLAKSYPENLAIFYRRDRREHRENKKTKRIKLLTQFNAVSSLREISLDNFSRSDETVSNCVSNLALSSLCVLCGEKIAKGVY